MRYWLKSMYRLFLLSSLCAAGLMAAPAAPSADTQRIYRVRCAPCHGLNGEGGTGASFHGKLAHPTQKAIADVIRSGIPGTAMPALTSLPDPALKQLAAYVLYLNKKK